MKLLRFLRAVPFLALLGGLAGGCNTYHYYDIDVMFMSPFTSTQASVMKSCQAVVSGAASDILDLKCPPSFPDMGVFEYSTFVDSGSLTFTVKAFYDTPHSDSNQCTAASTTLPATSEITTMGTVTLTDFNATNCPLMVTQ